MSGSKSKTTQEVLLAELLGDVGKLHDAIQALPESLAIQTGALVSIAEKTKTQIDEYTAIQKNVLAKALNDEKITFRNELKIAMEKEAGEALSHAARALDNAALAINNKIKIQDKYIYLTIIATAILCLVCGFIGGMAAYQYQNAQNFEQKTYGYAVTSIWHQLDKKTQYKIQEARKHFE